MSKNGFFHERPGDYDIYVDEAIAPMIGAESINWHVQSVSHEGDSLVADVAYEGHTYIALLQEQGVDAYWTIIEFVQ